MEVHSSPLAIKYLLQQNNVLLLDIIYLVVGFQVLDADNGRGLVSSTGRVATRDIVQFVPMREVESK